MELPEPPPPDISADYILNPDLDQPAHLDQCLLRELQSSGTSDSISIFDISRDGRINLQRTDNDEHSVQSGLPDLPENATRIVLTDSWTHYKNITQVDQELPISPGKLVHDRGEALQVLDRPAFKSLQMIVFDKWNLQSLWRPNPSSSSQNICPLNIQTNILETLLEHSDNVEESFEQSRQLLFLGPHTVEFWESLSSIRAVHSSEGRAECEFYNALKRWI